MPIVYVMYVCNVYIQYTCCCWEQSWSVVCINIYITIYIFMYVHKIETAHRVSHFDTKQAGRQSANEAPELWPERARELERPSGYYMTARLTPGLCIINGSCATACFSPNSLYVYNSKPYAIFFFSLSLLRFYIYICSFIHPSNPHFHNFVKIYLYTLNGIFLSTFQPSKATRVSSSLKKILC